MHRVRLQLPGGAADPDLARVLQPALAGHQHLDPGEGGQPGHGREAVQGEGRRPGDHRAVAPALLAAVLRGVEQRGPDPLLGCRFAVLEQVDPGQQALPGATAAAVFTDHSGRYTPRAQLAGGDDILLTLRQLFQGRWRRRNPVAHADTIPNPRTGQRLPDALLPNRRNTGTVSH